MFKYILQCKKNVNWVRGENIVLYVFSMAGADKFMVFFDYILHIADNRAKGGEAYPH